MSFVDALTQAILPVLAMAGAGFVLGNRTDVDVGPITTVTIYILLPALAFSSIAKSSISGAAIGSLVVGILGYNLIMIGAAEGVASLLGESGPVRSGLVLTSTFANGGNYGIPIAAFAFGDVGRATAVLFAVIQTISMYTIGVYVASRGALDSWLSAAEEVFRLPLLYAVLAAWLFRFLDIVPPADSTIMQVITLTGDSSIPLMLIMLGIQLANTSYGATISRVWAPVTLKMAVAPLVAIALVLPLGFADPEVGRVFVLECAMPAAIVPLMLTIEYGHDGGEVSGPAYVSTIILVTTLLSIPTLAILITILQSGLIL